MAQNQIGNNTTASSPFVTARDVVYFRGTDDKLWKVNGDGTGLTQIGTNKTKSTPFVFADPVTGEWVYFQGTDDKLWKVRGDSAGTGLTQIGTNKTKSTPFVTFDSSTGDVWVYFQGTDDKLWRYFQLVGGKQAAFTARQNGWHFNNDFVNRLFGGLLETQGLCGGMAYSALDYYFSDLPIPTHRQGDFGTPDATVPPDGRLHTMIFSRLIDSFADNFGKWSCVYPALDAAVGAALGLVVGGACSALWSAPCGEVSTGSSMRCLSAQAAERRA